MKINLDVPEKSARMSDLRAQCNVDASINLFIRGTSDKPLCYDCLPNSVLILDSKIPSAQQQNGHDKDDFSSRFVSGASVSLTDFDFLFATACPCSVFLIAFENANFRAHELPPPETTARCTASDGLWFEIVHGGVLQPRI